MGSTLDILKDFPPVTKEEWRAKVEADLKGKPFERRHSYRLFLDLLLLTYQLYESAKMRN